MELELTWRHLPAADLASHGSLQPQGASEWRLHVLDPLQQELEDQPSFFQVPIQLPTQLQAAQSALNLRGSHTRSIHPSSLCMRILTSLW